MCVKLLKTVKYLMQRAAAAKVRQSCPTLCDPIDSSPAGSTVPGILQARMLEWVWYNYNIKHGAISIVVW